MQERGREETREVRRTLSDNSDEISSGEAWPGLYSNNYGHLVAETYAPVPPPSGVAKNGVPVSRHRCRAISSPSTSSPPFPIRAGVMVRCFSRFRAQGVSRKEVPAVMGSGETIVSKNVCKYLAKFSQEKVTIVII